MVTTHYLNEPNICGVIHHNRNVIELGNDCDKTFSERPIIGFIRLPNLRDIQTEAAIAYPLVSCNQAENATHTLHKIGEMH